MQPGGERSVPEPSRFTFFAERDLFFRCYARAKVGGICASRLILRNGLAKCDPGPCSGERNLSSGPSDGYTVGTSLHWQGKQRVNTNKSIAPKSKLSMPPGAKCKPAPKTWTPALWSRITSAGGGFRSCPGPRMGSFVSCPRLATAYGKASGYHVIPTSISRQCHPAPPGPYW